MARAVSEIQVSKLATYATSPISNSQPAGIGRLVAIDGALIVNNLGRNIEISTPHEGALEPLHVFQETAFPGEDEPSQFDLDYHGFLALQDRRQLIAINHHGIIRLLTPAGSDSVFGPSSNGRCFELSSERNLKWPGDAERFVLAGSSLISSSPRGYEVDDAAEPGILISLEWSRAVAGHSETMSDPFGAIHAHHIRYRQALADWGVITALALSGSGQLLAVAAGSRIGVLSLDADSGGEIQIEQLLWERKVASVISWLHFTEDSNDLLIGGCSLSAVDDTGADWESLKGGELSAFDLTAGGQRWLSELHVDLAWGNGGDPLVYVPGRKQIAGVDRTGSLYLFDLAGGHASQFTGAQSGKSMGIAHATWLDDSIYCGFNRGGYYVFRYAL